MAAHEPNLHELCYPYGVPWKHNSSSPPTKRKTLQEHCYPDIIYVCQEKLKSSLRIREQLNANSKSHWLGFDTDLMPPPLSFADDYEQRIWKVKVAILEFKYQDISDPGTFLAKLDEQLNQLVQLVSENRSRETFLDESISEPNQFISSDLEISTHVPEQLVHNPIPNFQVNPNFIPSDSTLNYPIQYESKPPSVHPYQIKN